jgi:2-polyprenyl-3-methyl-5-hydroxy-6-metoxy-1,4-benzoquinol methylase
MRRKEEGMDQFWEQVWKTPNLKVYEHYIEKHLKESPDFIRVFKEYHIKSVCDAACGFGAYSAMLAVNGFDVAGFDIAASSIELTSAMLEKQKIDTSGYIISDIADISFPSERFDAVVAHAVLDHLPAKKARKAVEELLRIVKENGLIYLSFDGLNEEDLKQNHTTLEDGSFQYLDEGREGLLFKYYRDEEIDDLLKGKHMIYRLTREQGDREVIIQKC